MKKKNDTNKSNQSSRVPVSIASYSVAKEFNLLLVSRKLPNCLCLQINYRLTEQGNNQSGSLISLPDDLICLSNTLLPFILIIWCHPFLSNVVTLGGRNISLGRHIFSFSKCGIDPGLFWVSIFISPRWSVLYLCVFCCCFWVLNNVLLWLICVVLSNMRRFYHAMYMPFYSYIVHGFTFCFITHECVFPSYRRCFYNIYNVTPPPFLSYMHFITLMLF